MIVRSKQQPAEHQAYILLSGKKTLLHDSIPGLVREEWEGFLSADESFRHLQIGGVHYFFVGNKTTDEAWRIAGHDIRKALPAAIESVYINGGKTHALLVAEGLLLSNYQFLKYRKEREKEQYKLSVIDFDSSVPEADIHELISVSNAVLWARDLVNEPVSFLTATQFSAELNEMANTAGIKCTVLEKSMIESLKMGGLLAVNRGSVEPPTFTILEYKPSKPVNKKPVILVGKGVVYDTGGLSLKPTPSSMDLMKSDMAGAAAMAGTIFAVAELKLPVHLIVLIPATDNRPGENAYTPGDVIEMHNGTTVEVLNTDAEGRMILADALSYSDRYKPELVIDAATLTGAAVRAIGTKASVIMGNAPRKQFDLLAEAGNETHERVVELPFWDEYLDEMKSKIADLKNIGGPNAGMITAGKFLETFVKAPYIHMDIAGPAFLEAPENYKGFGGTGHGVRLLVRFLKKLSE